jgi:hypothetical protein
VEARVDAGVDDLRHGGGEAGELALDSRKPGRENGEVGPVAEERNDC